jgi:hypothetical protein
MAILMFSMTLYKCSEHLLAVRGQRMPVITLFLRDGVFFFLTILRASNSPHAELDLIWGLYTVITICGTRNLAQWSSDPCASPRHVSIGRCPSQFILKYLCPDPQRRQPLSFVSIRCLNLFGFRLHAVVGARVLLNIKNLATEVNDSTIPTVELSDISYRQRLFAAKARIPWYLQTLTVKLGSAVRGDLLAKFSPISLVREELSKYVRKQANHWEDILRVGNYSY